MKKRQTTESIGFGAVLKVMLVGVLLFAVIWQLNGTIQDTSAPVDTSSPPVVANEPTAQPFVTTDDVNLRRGPGIEHEVMAVVPMHAEVTVTGEGQNGFVPVAINGTSAWVSGDYLVPQGTVLGSTSADLPVVETPTAAPVPETGDPPASAETVVAIPDPPAELPEEDPPVALAARTYVEPVEEPVVEEPGERWVDVDRSTATVTLYEGDRVVARFPALIGKDPSPDGYYATAVGTYNVHTMWEGLAETPFAEGVYLTHFVGFDPARSNGFHSPTRDADGNIVQTGGTSTLGCVRLGEADAIRMFEFAFIGMRVEVHD